MFTDGQPVVVNEGHPFYAREGKVVKLHADKWYALDKTEPLRVYLVELEFVTGGGPRLLQFPIREDDLSPIEQGEDDGQR